MKSITILITPDGKVTIEGQGFVGKECDAKMKAFEEQLLGPVKERTNKSEYYATNTTKQRILHPGG